MNNGDLRPHINYKSAMVAAPAGYALSQNSIRSGPLPQKPPRRGHDTPFLRVDSDPLHLLNLLHEGLSNDL
jgi:hypothetical protein